MSLRETALIAGLVLNGAPVVSAYFRYRKGLSWVVTLLTAACMSGFLAVTWLLVVLKGRPEAEFWALGLLASGVPVLLTGFLFSGTVGRDRPEAALRVMGRPFAILLGFGVLALIFLTDRAFLSGYRWEGGTGLLGLGAIGKAYLSYLLVGTVFVGRNLERAFRLSGAKGQSKLQPVVLGLFGVLGFLAYILTTGLVYGEIDIDNVVALVVPLGVANILTSYGFLRGSLIDSAVPVSRDVVYTSFTTLVALGYFLAMGTAAQLVSLTGWSPGHVVTASFVFLVLLVAVVFMFSGRFKTAVRRFIDRHFYANRVDYRAHWSRVAGELDPSAGAEQLLIGAEALLREVFHTGRVTLALRHGPSRSYRPVRGLGVGTGVELPEASPLVEELRRTRRGLFPGRASRSRTVGEPERRWVGATAAQAIAPLLSGDDLLGVVGIERDRDERFSFEDLELLEGTAAQIAAVLRGAQWGRELADAREMELISNWSNMLLHDLKNYLSPLNMIVRNMRVHIGNPDFQREAVEDIASVAKRMDELVRRLSHLRQDSPLAQQVVDLSALVERSLDSIGAGDRPGITVTTEFEPETFVQGEETMLRRVIENLAGNALEAMADGGTLTVVTRTVPDRRGPGHDVILEVRDTGPGMDEAFQNTRLFRPFATTKKRGMGLGLYQCRSIVEAHGGEILVDSRVGDGTVFQVVLPGRVAPPSMPPETARRPVAAAARDS